jgi:cation diffusion facilitator CzcD-associated flavoprotein CzcO
MAIELQRAGITSFELFERADRVGGVWRENTYPGAGCDLPSPFYSFSFEPNPGWPWRYAKQDSILEYLEHCVTRYAIADRIRLGAEVTRATFVETSNTWSLIVDDRAREFDVLICACGQLSEPATPRFSGVEQFRGHSFHSADWDHAHDLTGRRVAVIGTGASAIQFVPEIAPQVTALHLFQRSAPFVLPKPDRFYSERRHAMFERFPALLSTERLGWFLLSEFGQMAISEHPGWLTPAAAAARWHLRRAVADPVKRTRLEPEDRPGCKRLLFSNDYYPALARDNVEVIAEGVASLGPTTVTTESGLTREVDTIIYATGFAAHGFVAPMEVSGRAGRSLADDAWADGAHAHLGVTVPGFPNLFLLYGPNTNLGTGSIVYMLESAARYVRDAVAEITRRPHTAFEVRPERAALYDAEIQRRLRSSVWASGCQSWYVDENGRHANNWPGTMSEYRWRVRQFNIDDFTGLRAPARTRSEEGVPR